MTESLIDALHMLIKWDPIRYLLEKKKKTVFCIPFAISNSFKIFFFFSKCGQLLALYNHVYLSN